MMVNIRQISPELAIKARDELFEVESRIPEDIATLRGWIEKQPHLKARTDDQILLTFLRGAKYSLEKAKQKIDYFYTIKTISPELFLNKIVDDKVMRLARLGTFIPLPKPLKSDGPRIHITRYDHINFSEYSIVDLFKYEARVFDIEMREDDNSVIAGIINVIDMSNISMSFIMQLNPVLMKKFTVYSEKAIPFRIKGGHLINVPEVALTIINFARSIISKKLNERMIVHSSLESLYEYVPKEYLPEEYGGSNGRLEDNIEHWEKRVHGYKEFFEDDLKYQTDEKLRVGTEISSESLFGVDGTFRKLEVD